MIVSNTYDRWAPYKNKTPYGCYACSICPWAFRFAVSSTQWQRFVHWARIDCIPPTDTNSSMAAGLNNNYTFDCHQIELMMHVLSFRNQVEPRIIQLCSSILTVFELWHAIYVMKIYIVWCTFHPNPITDERLIANFELALITVLCNTNAHLRHSL